VFVLVPSNFLLNLTDADLREARLSRATMPDGSTHP
jgi:hypothetical protein